MSTPAQQLTQPCTMAGTADEVVALVDVNVTARLRDLVSEVTVTQVYRNDEQKNIEAVYTFPLPMDAVLMDLHVDIAGRKLRGVVVEKKQAERRYEEAVEAGDSAVMLEQLESGLCTMNVGNLQPGETAAITFTYSLVHRWSGDRLRFHLPTTVAPRYGRSPFEPHQQTEHSLEVENCFALSMEVTGALAGAQFICPSHEVQLRREKEALHIEFSQERAVMDRDFVLEIKAPPAARNFALAGSDGDGTAVLAGFQPFFPGLRQSEALNLVLLIDCSGSMGGDSIAQARQALAGILDALRPDDRVGLVAFGSSFNCLSKKLLACSDRNLAKLRKFAGNLDADMGGTEIGAALEEAYRQLGHSPGNVFVVTDGQVGAWEDVVQFAVDSGHRVFTVGVGSAVTEAFVRQVAERTGGHSELVSPREGMSDRIVRHFERMRAPRATKALIHWPEGALDLTPSELGPVFEGDTVICSARFAEEPGAGKVTLEVHTESGEVHRQSVGIGATRETVSEGTPSRIARLAAAMRLEVAGEEAGRETALQYQLMSRWTNYLVIDERPEGEKAEGMPELRKVPQTLAAGWHGVGSMSNDADEYLDIPSFYRSLDQTDVLASRSSTRMLKADISEFVDDDLPPPESYSVAPEWVVELCHRIEAHGGQFSGDAALELMTQACVPDEWLDLIAEASQLGLRPEAMATTMLAKLLDALPGYMRTGNVERCYEWVLCEAKEIEGIIHELTDRAYRLGELLADSVSRRVFESNDSSLWELTQRGNELRELLLRLDGLVPQISRPGRQRRRRGRLEALRRLLD